MSTKLPYRNLDPILHSGAAPRTEAQAKAERDAKHRTDLLTRAAAVRKNPTPAGDIVAAHYERQAAEIKQTLEWRLQNLRDAVVQSRKNWRLLWGRVYQLNQEQVNYIVGWRTEMLNSTWRRAREEVVRYAQLRKQLRDLTAEGASEPALPVVDMNIVETLEG